MDDRENFLPNSLMHMNPSLIRIPSGNNIPNMNNLNNLINLENLNHPNFATIGGYPSDHRSVSQNNNLNQTQGSNQNLTNQHSAHPIGPNVNLNRYPLKMDIGRDGKMKEVPQQMLDRMKVETDPTRPMEGVPMGLIPGMAASSAMDNSVGMNNLVMKNTAGTGGAAPVTEHKKRVGRPKGTSSQNKVIKKEERVTTSSSGYPGVSWNKRMCAWLAFFYDGASRRSRTFHPKHFNMDKEKARLAAVEFMKTVEGNGRKRNAKKKNIVEHEENNNTDMYGNQMMGHDMDGTSSGSNPNSNLNSMSNNLQMQLMSMNPAFYMNGLGQNYDIPGMPMNDRSGLSNAFAMSPSNLSNMQKNMQDPAALYMPNPLFNNIHLLNNSTGGMGNANAHAGNNETGNAANNMNLNYLNEILLHTSLLQGNLGFPDRGVNSMNANDFLGFDDALNLQNKDVENLMNAIFRQNYSMGLNMNNTVGKNFSPNHGNAGNVMNMNSVNNGNNNSNNPNNNSSGSNGNNSHNNTPQHHHMLLSNGNYELFDSNDSNANHQQNLSNLYDYSGELYRRELSTQIMDMVQKMNNELKDSRTMENANEEMHDLNFGVQDHQNWLNHLRHAHLCNPLSTQCDMCNNSPSHNNTSSSNNANNSNNASNNNGGIKNAMDMNKRKKPSVMNGNSIGNRKNEMDENAMMYDLNNRLVENSSNMNPAGAAGVGAGNGMNAGTGAATPGATQGGGGGVHDNNQSNGNGRNMSCACPPQMRNQKNHFCSYQNQSTNSAAPGENVTYIPWNNSNNGNTMNAVGNVTTNVKGSSNNNGGSVMMGNGNGGMTKEEPADANQNLTANNGSSRNNTNGNMSNPTTNAAATTVAATAMMGGSMNNNGSNMGNENGRNGNEGTTQMPNNGNMMKGGNGNVQTNTTTSMEGIQRQDFNSGHYGNGQNMQDMQQTMFYDSSIMKGGEMHDQMQLMKQDGNYSQKGSNNNGAKKKIKERRKSSQTQDMYDMNQTQQVLTPMNGSNNSSQQSQQSVQGMQNMQGQTKNQVNMNAPEHNTNNNICSKLNSIISFNWKGPEFKENPNWKGQGGGVTGTYDDNEA